MKLSLTTLPALCAAALFPTAPASAQTAPDPRAHSLTAMSLTKTVKPFHALDGISGITYNPRTGTLFCIKNVNGGAGSTFEVTPDGILLRTITHMDFEDTEAISWVTSFRSAGGTLFDVFLIAEEDHSVAAAEGRLSLCLLSATATTLDRDDANGTDPDNTSTTTAYSNGTLNNRCIEAATFDFTRGVCYYTAEKQTENGTPNKPGDGSAKILTRPVTATATALSFGPETELCDINALFFPGGALDKADISDMCYSAQDDALLLLSHEGEKVLRITRGGQPVESLTTPGEQLEGLTLDPAGTSLWVTGEDATGGRPGEFFRYEFKPGPVLTNTAPLDFPATAATAVADLTLTVNGAVPGDSVAPGIPNESITPTGMFTAWVSAPNTVTVRFSPKAEEDPAAGTFRATVFRQ